MAFDRMFTIWVSGEHAYSIQMKIHEVQVPKLCLSLHTNLFQSKFLSIIISSKYLSTDR